VSDVTKQTVIHLLGILALNTIRIKLVTSVTYSIVPVVVLFCVNNNNNNASADPWSQLMVCTASSARRLRAERPDIMHSTTW